LNVTLRPYIKRVNEILCGNVTIPAVEFAEKKAAFLAKRGQSDREEVTSGERHRRP
jgi:hypothetical protein